MIDGFTNITPLLEMYATDCAWVYMLSLKGEIVYVGFSADLRNRLGSHIARQRRDRNWAFDGVHIRSFPDRLSAYNAEQHLISDLRPRYNTKVAEIVVPDSALCKALGFGLPKKEPEEIMGLERRL